MRFERVLVATDFSEAARIAMYQALPLCEPTAPFEIVHVVPWPELGPGPPSRVSDKRLAKVASDRVQEAQREMSRFVKGLPLDPLAHRILNGSITTEIRLEAASYKADLVVVGACRHASPEHYFLGSKARALLWANAHAASVFVGRQRRSPGQGQLRLAVATDFGPPARAAADRGASLLPWPGREVHLIHTLDTGVWLGETALEVNAQKPTEPGTYVRSRAMNELRAENARAFQGRAHEHLLVGDPANAIIQFAKDERIDVLILGTAGPRHEGPVILGSVAADVAEKAQCSVLVVRGGPTPSTRVVERVVA